MISVPPSRALKQRVLTQRPLMLNLGSGPSGPESWINIDYSPTMLFRSVPRLARVLRRVGLIGDQHLVAWQPHIVRRNLAKRLPCADGTVDAIYSSHFLEHVYLGEAAAVLRECHRVLRPEGILRLALPDGEVWARELIAAGDDSYGVAARRYHERLLAHPEDRPVGKRALAALVGGHIHRWQPTRGLVRSMLIEAGFSDDAIADRTFLDGEMPELSEVETRDESFFIEARR